MAYAANGCTTCDPIQRLQNQTRCGQHGLAYTTNARGLDHHLIFDVPTTRPPRLNCPEKKLPYEPGC
eukprot:5331428-Amphidinium_carterae.1